MAKKANMVFTEEELKKLTSEELAEIAIGLKIETGKIATDEEAIAAILKAQSDSAGTDPQAKTDPAPDKPLDDKAEYSVTSKERKGKTIIAASGKPIVFDNDGKAKVDKADAEYLKNCAGFTIG